MRDEGVDGWWDDDGPLPDYVPCDDEPEPVTAPADPLDDAVYWTRRRNQADAQTALAVYELLRTTPALGRVSRHDQVAAEIAPAFGWGTGAALNFVQVTDLLASRLRATFQQVIDGRLDWFKATKLAEYVAPLSPEHARQVEAKCLPKAAERTPARHCAAVRRAVAQVDPE